MTSLLEYIFNMHSYTVTQVKSVIHQNMGNFPLGVSFAHMSEL